jgi:hypothetical protein
VQVGEQADPVKKQQILVVPDGQSVLDVTSFDPKVEFVVQYPVSV